MTMTSSSTTTVLAVVVAAGLLVLVLLFDGATADFGNNFKKHLVDTCGQSDADDMEGQQYKSVANGGLCSFGGDGKRRKKTKYVHHSSAEKKCPFFLLSFLSILANGGGHGHGF